MSARSGAAAVRRQLSAPRRHRRRDGGAPMSLLHGPEPHVSRDAGYVDPPPRMGFFTDTSICIGCKACEVACKEWNAVPDDGYELLGMSFDNTGMLGANSWRHVAFIEQSKPLGRQDAGFAKLPSGPAGIDQAGERAAAVLSVAAPGEVR